jgi:hypothetical protein
VQFGVLVAKLICLVYIRLYLDNGLLLDVAKNAR